VVKTLLAGARILSVISGYAAGLLGAVTMMAVGPYLAMGAQMYAGNTEPLRPHVPWPMIPTFLGLMLPVPWLVRKQWGYAALATLPLALLPYWQLYRLYAAAGVP
jgi:hypothetical protein